MPGPGTHVLVSDEVIGRLSDFKRWPYASKESGPSDTLPRVLADLASRHRNYYALGADDRACIEGVDLKSAARLLSRKIAFKRGCDEMEALFYVHVDGLRPKECRVYRIKQTAGEARWRLHGDRATSLNQARALEA